MMTSHKYFDYVFGFFIACNIAKAHNILIIMLGPYFKNMKSIHDFMGDILLV
jgi:hypothetical protein